MRHSHKSHVRFTPKSGHVQCKEECPLWANSELVVAGTMAAKPRSWLRLDEMGFDHFLVPFESYSRHIGYMQEPVLDLVGPLENWIGPILPL